MDGSAPKSTGSCEATKLDHRNAATLDVGLDAAHDVDVDDPLVVELRRMKLFVFTLLLMIPS